MSSLCRAGSGCRSAFLYPKRAQRQRSFAVGTRARDRNARFVLRRSRAVGEGSGGEGGGLSQAKYTLVLYYKPGCESCDVLKRKVKALLDRAKFVPSPLAEAVLEERDINDEIKWLWKYGGSIPELTCISGGGDGDSDAGENEEREILEVLLPRVNYRDTTDSIGKQIEKSLLDLEP